MVSTDAFSTPMMQQYLQLKRQHADCVLWFRLGDFYEMFLEDAELGANVLGITLTSRARGKDGRIPMAGVPYHAAESYIHKLIKAGHKVAICEQVSQPNGRTLVDRQVVRIVTPGTVLQENSLDSKRNNFVMSLVVIKQQLGIALADVSTGEFRAGSVSISAEDVVATVKDVLGQFQPQEIILPASLLEESRWQNLLAKLDLPFSKPEAWPTWLKDSQLQRRTKPRHKTQFNNVALSAAQALLGYLDHTQQVTVRHLRPLEPLLPNTFLQLDTSTIANLELLEPLAAQQSAGSLIKIIDQTLTPMGGRLLKQWVLKPLLDQAAIETRQSGVAELHSQRSLRHQVQTHLKKIPDLERLLARLSVGLGNPRDILNIALALQQVQVLQEMLDSTSLAELVFSSSSLQNFSQTVVQQLQEQPPIDPKSGGIFAVGFNAELDQLRQVRSGSKEIIARIEAQERARTGISSLKVKYNQVFGFYIEISKANLAAVPDDYFRKQTLVNAERFITPELKEQEEIVLAAEEKITTLEYELFLQLTNQVLQHTTTLQDIAQRIAQLDCLQSLAEVAEQRNYTRPVLTTTGELHLTDSRHPVVECLLEDHDFVPNSVELNQSNPQVMLLTGPNMAGKSVLMRQVALNAILAQMGSFIPASTAQIGIVDRIFVRSGAADMITAGLSTFMVEMVETAYILQHATPASLIIMDEIGRGTSTFDGISLAWAIAEHLVQHSSTGPKTLFATHYHELQELAERYPSRIQNFHMAITEHRQQPVFLYTLTPGGASHSYGLAVAALAGLPKTVIQRASQLLGEMEQAAQDTPAAPTAPAAAMPAAASSRPPLASSRPPEANKILTELSQLSPESMTPLEALTTITVWKKTIDEAN